jgi:hypothetical protein
MACSREEFLPHPNTISECYSCTVVHGTRVWEDNIKVDIEGIGYDGADFGLW